MTAVLGKWIWRSDQGGSWRQRSREGTSETRSLEICDPACAWRPPVEWSTLEVDCLLADRWPLNIKISPTHPPTHPLPLSSSVRPPDREISGTACGGPGPGPSLVHNHLYSKHHSTQSLLVNWAFGTQSFCVWIWNLFTQPNSLWDVGKFEVWQRLKKNQVQARLRKWCYHSKYGRLVPFLNWSATECGLLITLVIGVAKIYKWICVSYLPPTLFFEIFEHL